MELLFDRSSPLHAVAVVVLVASGLLCAFVGVRLGLLRRGRAAHPVLAGPGALAIGLYLAAGLAALAGAALFLLRAR